MIAGLRPVRPERAILVMTPSSSVVGDRRRRAVALSIALLCGFGGLARIADATWSEPAKSGADAAAAKPSGPSRRADARHEILAHGPGHRARHPENAWLLDFVGRGLCVRPDDGRWAFGLELARVWIDDVPMNLREEPIARATGARLDLSCGSRIAAWWLDDACGVEHGIVIDGRVADTSAPASVLRVEFHVRSDLRLVVSDDGSEVRGVADDGLAPVALRRPSSADALDRVAPTRFEATETGFAVRVDVRDARFPLTIGPFTLQSGWDAAGIGPHDLRGAAVAIDEAFAAVGAPLEDVTTPDGIVPDAGAVRVHDVTTRGERAVVALHAPEPSANDHFGAVLAMAGDTLVVSAPDATVGGERAAGRVHVFVRSSEGAWCPAATWSAPEIAAGARFGESLGLSRDTLVVAARSGAGAARRDGVVRVYEGAGTAWSRVAELAAPGTPIGAEATREGSESGPATRFGAAVAVSGDTLVVGAPGERSGGADVGTVHVFERSGGCWSWRARLAVDAGDASFGSAVAIDGDTILVGAYRRDAVDAPGSGAAYVFVRRGGTWELDGELVRPIDDGSPDDVSAGSDPAGDDSTRATAKDWFGYSVAVRGERAWIGAPGVDAVAADGGDPLEGAGAAFEFRRGPRGWAMTSRVVAPTTSAGDFFGACVSATHDAVLVGAPRAPGSFRAIRTRAIGAAWTFASRGTVLGTGRRLDPVSVVLDASHDPAR